MLNSPARWSITSSRKTGNWNHESPSETSTARASPLVTRAWNLSWRRSRESPFAQLPSIAASSGSLGGSTATRAGSGMTPGAKGREALAAIVKYCCSSLSGTDGSRMSRCSSAIEIRAITAPLRV